MDWFLYTNGLRHERVKEISMKEITMHLSKQNCKSQLNLILFFFQVPPFIRVNCP